MLGVKHLLKHPINPKTIKLHKTDSNIIEKEYFYSFMLD